MFEESTAVARYDAVTQEVAIADLAALVARAQPTRMVPVLPPRPHVAPAPARAPAKRRLRVGLGLLVFVAVLATWGVVAYEVWYLFLR